MTRAPSPPSPASSPAHAGEAIARGKEELDRLHALYLLRASDLEPTVFVRFTHDYVVLSLRFLVSAHGVRNVKDAVSREVLRELGAAGIDIASATLEIARLPPLEVART